MSAELIFGEIAGQEENKSDLAVFKMRVASAWERYLSQAGLEGPRLKVSSSPGNASDASADSGDGDGKKGAAASGGTAPGREVSLDARAAAYQSQKPFFTFEQLIVAPAVREQLLLASRMLELERRVFDDWGLRKIEPFPRAALNFYGEPGTGKTLAAHALASHLESNILLASYAQIESMYHGEGPKNVEAVFHAAQRDGALLFIDEADSLLSKRLTTVTQGSEQAINSMRSQLLICLEKFKGVVVFATNLVENYDVAFETRVRNIHFPLPDFEARGRIWKAHFPSELPLSADVDIEELAKVDGVCGREIKNAVIDAALRVALNGQDRISLADLVESIRRILASRISRAPEFTTHALNAEEQELVRASIEAAGDVGERT